MHHSRTLRAYVTHNQDSLVVSELHIIARHFAGFPFHYFSGEYKIILFQLFGYMPRSSETAADISALFIGAARDSHMTDSEFFLNEFSKFFRCHFLVQHKLIHTEIGIGYNLSFQTEIFYLTLINHIISCRMGIVVIAHYRDSAFVNKFLFYLGNPTGKFVVPVIVENRLMHNQKICTDFFAFSYHIRRCKHADGNPCNFVCAVSCLICIAAPFSVIASQHFQFVK